MRIALKFAYDGREFNGYARQPQLKTIEGEIIKTLIEHGFIEDTKESYIRSGSRTDKGVSALSNVIAFNTDSSKERVFQVLKNNLTDILVYGIKDVEPDFYPRYAKCRTYRYYLENKDVDIDKILSAAASFAGEYDFSNFAKVEEFKDPVRTIDNIVLTPQDNFLIIDFYAQTFLWNQIRKIISAIWKMGMGKIEKEQIIEALHNPNKRVDFGLAPYELVDGL
jgi:tRNA pseudouridine38-40 synthase